MGGLEGEKGGGTEFGMKNEKKSNKKSPVLRGLQVGTFLAECPVLYPHFRPACSSNQTEGDHVEMIANSGPNSSTFALSCYFLSLCFCLLGALFSNYNKLSIIFNGDLTNID